MPMYAQLDDGQYTSLRKALLHRKGSEVQRELLEAARTNETFVDFIREHVEATKGEEIPIYAQQLSEHEFKEPPADTELAIYKTFPALTPANACRPELWGAITLRHIEEQRIEACYLAANGGSLPGGLERIDGALSKNDEAGIDSCVRTLLRRLSGLPEARGHRSVYVNCPFGRSWWRERLCEEICKTVGEPRELILGVLRLSQEYWERIVGLMVSRNSILGDRNTRDILVWVLARIKASNPENKILKASHLATFVRILGVRAAWQEFGILEPDELKQILEQDMGLLAD